MQKLRGLFLASVLLCAGSAHALQLSVHTPVHLSPQLNSQSRGGAGDVPNETFGLNYNELAIQYKKQHSRTSTRSPKPPLQYDKHKDW